MHWEYIDFIGLLGGSILLFAFWRTSTGTWKPTSAWYEFDNLIAAVLLIFYTWQKHAYVNILLNVVWGVVAFRGLSSFAERRMLRNKDFRRGYRKGKRFMKQVKKY
ncbi:MAG: hypothetical protein WAW63_03330 [Candidatus Saccharimonadales bacterium]|jgi:hypothetical protein|nr:hypothetical protein [Candidatus Saccharibacteria bacterium]